MNNKNINQYLKITLISLPLMLISLYLGSMYYYVSPWHKKITSARAVIYPTKGNTVTGTVSFVHEDNGVHVTAQLSGLKPGVHGFHIHEFGNCACDDGKCAGDHFNPTQQPHAGPEKQHRHAGDLGNIVADEQGNAVYDVVDAHIMLNGPHSIIGRSVIVHADPDDLTSQPSGNAGVRLGCGVIGVAQ
jgi:Cu-Zn family superoxide dismutase